MHVLTTKPGIVQGSSASIFSKNKTIGCCLGTFPRQNGCSETDAETMGFHLHMAFHQHHLKRPALKPTQPEGISHEVPFRIQHTLWLAAVRAREAVRESPQQTSALGLRADQTRVMKWVSAVIPSKPAAERRASMSSPM